MRDALYPGQENQAATGDPGTLEEQDPDSRKTESPELRDFPLALFGRGKFLHYVLVDEDRSWPGRTLCGRHLEEERILIEGDNRHTAHADRGLCGRCAVSLTPTLAESRAYLRCTDCKVDTWALGETFYQVKNRVWSIAYPGYYEAGIGVGESRPCIGCLEARLGRRLTHSDFTVALESHGPEVVSILSDRLKDRWSAPPQPLLDNELIYDIPLRG